MLGQEQQTQTSWYRNCLQALHVKFIHHVLGRNFPIFVFVQNMRGQAIVFRCPQNHYREDQTWLKEYLYQTRNQSISSNGYIYIHWYPRLPNTWYGKQVEGTCIVFCLVERWNNQFGTSIQQFILLPTGVFYERERTFGVVSDDYSS